jgi:hypothetical protein
MKLRQESGSAENEVTMQRLQTKVALVTGASMGFGAAIALRFGLEGAAVIVNYPVNESEAEKVVFDIVTSGGRAISVRADVTKREEVQTMVAQAVEAFGQLDILVNYPQPVLEKAGAHFSCAEPNGLRVVVDGKMVTGQSQYSASEYSIVFHHLLTGRSPVHGSVAA